MTATKLPIPSTPSSAESPESPESPEIPQPEPKVKTLVEQKADFTSEGAPPPGKVVGSVVPALTEAEAEVKPEGSKSTKKSHDAPKA